MADLYLVTGGAGFVGSHLVDYLVEAGERVRVVDDFSTGRRVNLESALDRIELIEGSVTDPEVCRKACAGVEFVLHQAALPSVVRSLADPLGVHDVNATGTLRLLLAARDAGVRRFVYAGSSSAYGDTPELPKREDMAPQPRSPYAASKLAGELYCRAATASYGVETVSLRYFNVFGARQDPASQYAAVVPVFMVAGLEERAPTIDGDGAQTRDFTHVANVVRANLLACHAKAPGVVGEVFNVGCGERISINRLWAEIRELVGGRVAAEYGPPRPGDVRDSLADLSRIRTRLDYDVETTLREGLAHTCAWFRARMGGRVSGRPQ
ncbi:MAG: SDR family oxidoreductase [Gemmatimonadetes bacterium]|nr:SDR family oxidoreductase [Gemmatimonadota bacterium]